MILTLLAVVFLGFGAIGTLLYLVYRETELDFPPRQCAHRQPVGD